MRRYLVTWTTQVRHSLFIDTDDVPPEEVAEKIKPALATWAREDLSPGWPTHTLIGVEEVSA